MNAEQLISIHLETYRSMRRELGEDNDDVAAFYAKLKDMIIVEAYFMRSIRYLVKDDEMSGFVLYIDKFIKNIVDNYDGSRGYFMPYLKESLEKRALSYLEDHMCTVNMQRSCIEFQSAGYMSVAQPSPEEAFFIKEEELEAKTRQSRRFGILSRLCARNPIRRKKLFIFFCTMVPYLSRDVIDRFCESINCDRRQTLVIVNRLCSIYEQEESHRYSKSYLSRMVDYHWAKILEHEGHARVSSKPEKSVAMAEFHRIRLKESLSGMNNAKMNIPYSIVADVLNTDPTTVALYVMHSKHLLEKVLSSSPAGSRCRSFESGQEELPLFKPFSVFGIDAAGIPA